LNSGDEEGQAFRGEEEREDQKREKVLEVREVGVTIVPRKRKDHLYKPHSGNKVEGGEANQKGFVGKG